MTDPKIPSSCITTRIFEWQDNNRNPLNIQGKLEKKFERKKVKIEDWYNGVTVQNRF